MMSLCSLDDYGEGFAMERFALTSAIAAQCPDTYSIPRGCSTHTYNALSFLPSK